MPLVGHSRDLTIAWVGAVILRRWQLTMALPLAVAGAALAATALMPARYASVASFQPVPRRLAVTGIGALGAFAQLSPSLGTRSPDSPHFYADLLRSRELLERALLSRIPPNGAGARRRLLDVLDPRGDTPEERLESGVRRLRRMVSTMVDPRTSIVTFAVTAREALTAQATVALLLDGLNEAIVRRRSLQAGESRRFAEARLHAADSALKRAATRLRAFRSANRRWEESRALAFEEARLRRDLMLREEIYVALSRQMELALIEETNAVPVLTIVNAPTLPQRRSGPRPPLAGLAAAIMAAVAGSAMALARAAREDFGPGPVE